MRSALGIILITPWAAQGAAGQKSPSALVHPKTASTTDANLKSARWHVLGARPLAMFYYTSDSVGLPSLKLHAHAITLLSPQCFFVDSEGLVRGQIPAEALEVARQNNLPLMPLLINPGFDRSIAHALLRDAQAQERTIEYLTYLAQRDRYLGWQLDIENIDPEDKAEYVTFVRRVAARLHRDHRLLSVAVVPRFSDDYPDNPAAGFRTGEWGAPFDFRGLGRVADFVTLMAYDQHSELTPPGAVAGYDWVKAAVEYAVQRMPSAKLVLGMPFYGRAWTVSSHGSKSQSLMFSDLKSYRESEGGEPHWDEQSRTPWFGVKDGVTQRTAWFDDSHSLHEKLGLIQHYHLRGFAAWRLGVEDPQFWPMSEQFEATQRAAAIHPRDPKKSGGASGSKGAEQKRVISNKP